MTVRVQTDPFNYGRECADFAERVQDAGAVVTFLGLVRDDGGKLSRMEIEHYPGMTQKALTSIADEATKRWKLNDTLILHRHGTLLPGEAIMMVAAAARHREAAFQAAEFLMDYLKSRAPFWKKEFGVDGAEWVTARDADEAALKKW